MCWIQRTKVFTAMTELLWHEFAKVYSRFLSNDIQTVPIQLPTTTEDIANGLKHPQNATRKFLEEVAQWTVHQPRCSWLASSLASYSENRSKGSDKIIVSGRFPGQMWSDLEETCSEFIPAVSRSLPEAPEPLKSWRAGENSPETLPELSLPKTVPEPLFRCLVHSVSSSIQV